MATVSTHLGLRLPAPSDFVDIDADLAENFEKIDTAIGTAYNVKAFGALGDDSTDDFDAISEAIDTCPEGGTVVFPGDAIYRVTEPVVFKRNRTYLGFHRPRWSYRGGVTCAIKPHASFAGDQIVFVPDKEIAGESADNDGGRIWNLAIDGNSHGNTIIGLRLRGLVRDWHIKDVDVSQTSGNGIVCDSYTRLDASVVHPRGIFMESPTVYSAGKSGGTGNGFVLNSFTDSTIQDGLAVDCEAHGYLIDAPGETKLVACRAVFNNADGFRVTGAVSVGGIQLLGPSTDRNGAYGIKVVATGTQPVQIVAPLCRRDAATTSGAAGIGVIGTVGNKVCPVTIVGVDTTIGVDDGGGGTLSPDYGVRAEYATYVQVIGTSWGVIEGVEDGGHVDVLDVARCYRRSTSGGTADTARVSAQPALAALANNGTSPPAPVIGADADDIRGSLTFGSGAAPAAGSQISVTFARPYAKAPVVTVVPTNGPAASRAPYASSITATGFNVALNTAAAASQANTTYGVGYVVVP